MNIAYPSTSSLSASPVTIIGNVTESNMNYTNIITSAEFTITSVAGQPIVIDIAKMTETVSKSTGISKISVVTTTSVSNVEVKVKQIEKPASVKTPPKTAINYLEISLDTPNENIQSAKITFKLNKADLRKQNIDVNTIKLLRYANGEWQELYTVLGFEDMENLVFEATTLGFGYFAVTGEEIKAPAETPKVTQQPQEEEQPEITLVSEKKEESPIGLILLIALVLVIGYILFGRKQGYKR